MQLFFAFQGDYLNTLFDRSDYLVIVGSDASTCDITELKKEYLVCKLKGAPKDAQQEVITQPKVQVNTGPVQDPRALFAVKSWGGRKQGAKGRSPRRQVVGFSLDEV